MTDLPYYTEGVCGDGAAILRDGVMMPIEDIVSELNRLTALAQPAPPAAGEVAAAIKRLRNIAEHMDQDLWAIENAAFLLGQHHPTPVPVGERLPGPGDCNKNGECWWFNRVAVSEWQLSSGGPYGDFWLPAHALPLPAGEGE